MQVVKDGLKRSSPTGFEKNLHPFGQYFSQKPCQPTSYHHLKGFLFFSFFSLTFYCRGGFRKPTKSFQMAKFSLKTYSPATKTEMLQFFILNKGKNSGKPLSEPCPNCFVLTAKSEEDKQFFYSLCFGLWKAKSFEYFLKGSVIPFITIGDCKQAINNGLEQAKTDLKGFNRSVKALEILDQQEKKYKETLLLINDAKRAIFYRYIKRK